MMWFGTKKVSLLPTKYSYADISKQANKQIIQASQKFPTIAFNKT